MEEADFKLFCLTLHTMYVQAARGASSLAGVVQRPPTALRGQGWAIGGVHDADSPGHLGNSCLHLGQGVVHHAVGWEAVQPGISISVMKR